MPTWCIDARFEPLHPHGTEQQLAAAKLLGDLFFDPFAAWSST